MYEKFPAIGYRYLVDFKAFRGELDFTSETSMTYHSLDANGQRVRPMSVANSQRGWLGYFHAMARFSIKAFPRRESCRG